MASFTYLPSEQWTEVYFPKMQVHLSLFYVLAPVLFKPAIMSKYKLYWIK